MEARWQVRTETASHEWGVMHAASAEKSLRAIKEGPLRPRCAGLASMILISTATGCRTQAASGWQEAKPVVAFVDFEQFIQRSDSLEFAATDSLAPSSVSGIAPLPDGRVVVADGRRQSIAIVDRQSHVMRRFGRKGSGPGEFRILRGVAVVAHDVVAALDVGLERVSFFDSAGTYMSAMSVAAQEPRALLADSDSAFIVAGTYRDRDGEHSLVWYSRDGRQLKAAGTPDPLIAATDRVVDDIWAVNLAGGGTVSGSAISPILSFRQIDGGASNRRLVLADSIWTQLPAPRSKFRTIGEQRNWLAGASYITGAAAMPGRRLALSIMLGLEGQTYLAVLSRQCDSMMVLRWAPGRLLGALGDTLLFLDERAAGSTKVLFTHLRQ